MNYEKLNGIWKGSYKYGNSYPDVFKDREEPFSLDIQFEGVNFKGICLDKFTDAYFKAPATVEGTFVPNLISFIKKYPGLLILEDNMQPIVDLDKPSMEIHYTGFFYKGLFSKTIRFQGEWIMTHFFLNESGKKEYYTLNGTWAMKK